jgi:hypothetical protein
LDDGQSLTLGSGGGVNGSVAQQAIVQSFLGLTKTKINVNLKVSHEPFYVGIA